eukprot:SAG11_NODE_1175_length_5601_cov_15.947110_6_plen_103_part_00
MYSDGKLMENEFITFFVNFDDFPPDGGDGGDGNGGAAAAAQAAREGVPVRKLWADLRRCVWRLIVAYARRRCLKHHISYDESSYVISNDESSYIMYHISYII